MQVAPEQGVTRAWRGTGGRGAAPDAVGCLSVFLKKKTRPPAQRAWLERAHSQLSRFKMTHKATRR